MLRIHAIFMASEITEWRAIFVLFLLSEECSSILHILRSLRIFSLIANFSFLTVISRKSLALIRLRAACNRHANVPQEERCDITRSNGAHKK